MSSLEKFIGKQLDVDPQQAIAHYLIHGEDVELILSMFSEDEITRKETKTLYKIAKELRRESETYDIVDIVQRLKDEGHSEKVKLFALKEPPVHYKPLYAVKQHKFEYIENKLRYYLQEWSNQKDIFHNHQGHLDKIFSYISQSGVNDQDKIYHQVEALSEAQDYIERLLNGEIHQFLLGLKPIDKILGGVEPGDLVVLAARPSVGKTALAMQIAQTMSKFHTVGFFSIEMSLRAISMRIIQYWTGFTKSEIENIDDYKEVFRKTKGQIQNRNIWLNDKALSFSNMRNYFKEMVKKNVEVIFIDYFQLITHKFRDNERGYSEISKQLKSLAKEYNIPVVLLAQLNREAEKDKYTKPNKSHLRNTGQLEQDADIIMLLYKPNPKDFSDEPEMQRLANLEELVGAVIDKNRNGETGEEFLHFSKKKMRISPIGHKGYEEPPSFTSRGAYA